jgi:hypothetical protein
MKRVVMQISRTWKRAAPSALLALALVTFASGGGPVLHLHPPLIARMAVQGRI